MPNDLRARLRVDLLLDVFIRSIRDDAAVQLESVINYAACNKLVSKHTRPEHKAGEATQTGCLKVP